MSTSKTKDKYQIAVVPGDGIGKEVMEATIFVLDSLGSDFNYVYGDAGDECLEIIHRYVGIIDEVYPRIMKVIWA